MTEPDKTPKAPKAPAGLRVAGRRLWTAITEEYLRDELEGIVRRDGPLIDTPQGQRAHPAAVELRQQRITLARLLAALRMPAGEEDDQPTGRRPQRRTGARGTYQMRNAA